MNRKFRILLIALTFLLAFLLISKPGEDKYLMVISSDYGQMHQGMDMSPKKLLEIGSGIYDDYFAFSIYRYTFGSIEVTYFGIAGTVYHLGYQKKYYQEKEDSKEPQAITFLEIEI